MTSARTEILAPIPLVHRLLDALTELLIYFGIVFSSWAFGTTNDWAVVIMNDVGYALGGLLVAKVAVRWVVGYGPARWGEHWGWNLWLTRILLVLSILLLAFCGISAWNARATYFHAEFRFEYHSIIAWLPHSYSKFDSLRCFWNYLALAGFFWAVRDWLLTRTENEEIFTLSHHMRAAHWQADIVPARLRRVLWVLCVNGALLGAEAIIQRVDGTDKLLWLVEPRVNKETETFFGVFAYRATAAQYFNLIWPLCLGFWWTYERARKKGEYHGTNHHVLLVCVMIMAACPVISYSRGGALIMAGMAALSIVVMVLAHWRSQWITKVVIFGSFAVVMYMALDLGGDVLEKRMQAISEGYMVREAMFETARKMPAEFPLFGSGPGSFEPLFQLYRSSTSEYWPAQLHNDWLETLITFGAVGMGLILTTFAVCLLHFFISNRIHGERHFVMLIWIALAGCLAHARFDFPLQVYSILLLFLLECAFLSVVSRRI